MSPASPLTKSHNVKLVREIDVADIFIAYKTTFDIDVKNLFVGTDKVQLYKCLDTGYQFFLPLNIAGDSEFYEHFQRYDWYYMDWKWEHETARRLIGSTDKVLEIGCGRGSFIERLAKNNVNCAGLELNLDAVRICQEKELEVFEQGIWEHASDNGGRYDVVCAFQVVEHIADIRGFLKASLAALRKGGKLIISVPNDDSFLGLDENNILNWPPHHMGLWNERLLRKLADLFSIRLDKIYIEPLQSYHCDYYLDTVSHHREKKYGFAGKILNRLTRNLLAKLVNKYPQSIKGFTALAEYTKL
jgi:SAM-dependent methyltransferase